MVTRVLKSAAGLLNWREVRLTTAYCPICDGRRLFIRLKDYDIACRCTGCRASAVSLSIASVLREVVPDLRSRDVYELSTRGPLYVFLQAHARTVTGSEYFHDVAPGDFRDGVQCQDVQRLTYADASFDVCTSTEVFEHVPDDARAFAQVLRVLRPGGILLFTVPLRPEHATLERAVLRPDGTIEHLLSPEYHGDPIRDAGRILAFRTYGQDITEKLQAAGFAQARIRMPRDDIPWHYARPVVFAAKAG